MYGYDAPRKVIAGFGSLGGLPAFLTQSGAKRIAIIIDPVLMETDPIRNLLPRLKESFWLDVHTGIVPEPSVEAVERLAEGIKKGAGLVEPDFIVAIGGGSTLDMAKLVAISFRNPGPIEAWMGVGKITKPGIPTILVPTTAGTGSEATPNAIVSGSNGTKAGIVSPFLMASTVILDPELTLTAPPKVIASTGIDALAHAVESYTGKKANPLSDDYAIAAVRGITSSLKGAYELPAGLAAREAMLVASFRAGQALTAAGTTAVHALAYAIGSAYHIPHGVANGMLLVPVLRFNSDACADRLGELCRISGIASEGKGGADTFLDYMEALVRDVGIPDRLSSFGAKESDIPGLAAQALKSARLMDNNPKTMGIKDACNIFEGLL